MVRVCVTAMMAFLLPGLGDERRNCDDSNQFFPPPLEPFKWGSFFKSGLFSKKYHTDAIDPGLQNKMIHNRALCFRFETIVAFQTFVFQKPVTTDQLANIGSKAWFVLATEFSDTIFHNLG